MSRRGARHAPTVVVVEDEPDILEIIRYHLERERFRVLAAADGVQAIDVVRRQRPDLVLLDLLLPGLDGLDVCRQLKESAETRTVPIVMVTAKGEESDIVLGLGLGADDYITKPFSPRELVARVKAVLRRSEQPATSDDAQGHIRAGLLTIDPAAFKARLADTPLELTATEFRLLSFLAKNPGRVFSRDQLIQRAMGEGVAVTDRNIDVHVRAIRKKLGAHRSLIETVRGVGYRFREGGE